MKKTPRVRSCDICGKRFLAPSHRERRCSEECRKAGRAKKHARWYYKNHSENVQRQRERRDALPEKSKERNLNKARKRAADNRARWTRADKRANVEYQIEYNRLRAARDPIFKAMVAVRARLGMAIRRRGVSRPSHRTESLLGCSWQAFLDHIESLFEQGMSWDNWGRDSWHIDHIVPLAFFDLSDSRECKAACNFHNQRPLWASQNLEKAAAMPPKKSVPVALRRMLLDLDRAFFSRQPHWRQRGRRSCSRRC